MTYAQRLLSLSILGALSLAFAPLTSAQTPDTDGENPIRAAIQECRDMESRDDIRGCLQGLISRLQNRVGNRRQETMTRNIPEKAREALRACKNEETREEKRKCAEEVAGQYDIEPPHHRGKKGGNRDGQGRGANIPEDAREDLRSCKDEKTREDKKACATAVAEEHGFDLPEHHGNRGPKHNFGRINRNASEEVREQLQVCRTSKDKKACIQDIRNNNNG